MLLSHKLTFHVGSPSSLGPTSLRPREQEKGFFLLRAPAEVQGVVLTGPAWVTCASLCLKWGQFPELHGVSLGLGRAQRKTKREIVITSTGRMIVEHAKARAINGGPHCSVGRFS